MSEKHKEKYVASHDIPSLCLAVEKLAYFCNLCHMLPHQTIQHLLINFGSLSLRPFLSMIAPPQTVNAALSYFKIWIHIACEQDTCKLPAEYNGIIFRLITLSTSSRR